EESEPLRKACVEARLAYVFLLSPNSTAERIQMVAQLAHGFIYCVALVGITGARDQLASDLDGFLARVRAASPVPLVVGFGISRPEHIGAIKGKADGVIVGGALADLIQASPAEGRPPAVPEWIGQLKAAC